MFRLYSNKSYCNLVIPFGASVCFKKRGSGATTGIWHQACHILWQLVSAAHVTLGQWHLMQKLLPIAQQERPERTKSVVEEKENGDKVLGDAAVIWSSSWLSHPALKTSHLPIKFTWSDDYLRCFYRFGKGQSSLCVAFFQKWLKKQDIHSKIWNFLFILFQSEGNMNVLDPCHQILAFSLLLLVQVWTSMRYFLTGNDVGLTRST